MQTTAALYLRISKDVAGEGYGIERQRHLCQDLAAARGWRVVAEFVDNDRSATRGKRPQFERLLAAMKAGEFGAVLAVDQDRLHRTWEDLARVLSLAESTGILLVTASGELDMSTADGRLTARIRGDVAAHEVEKMSERRRRTAAQNARNGKVANGGRRPYGYTVDRRRIVPAEAKVVREVARRLIAGESLTAVARDLNGRGVGTAGGRRWDSRRLRDVMARPRLCGRVEHRGVIVVDEDGEPVKGRWRPILDADTFDRVQTAMAARRPVDDRWSNRRRWLLSGTLTRCGVCGEKVVAMKQSSGVMAYRCRRHVTRNMRLTDQHVVAELIRHAAETPLTVTDWRDDEQADIADRIAELQARQVRAAEEFVDGGLSAAALTAMDAKFTREIAALREKQSESFTQMLTADAATFDLSGWDDLTLDDRRAALSLYIERIEIHPQQARGRGAWDPDAVRIRWRDPETLRFRAVVQ